MKLIKGLNVKAFEFRDLSEKAQEHAISEHIKFWVDGGRDYDEENKGNYESAIDEAEAMQTPWFVSTYIYEKCKDEVIEEIKANQYLFDESGELLPILYHMRGNQVEKISYSLTKTCMVEVILEEIGG